MSGSALDESLKAARKPGLQMGGGEGDTRSERQEEKQGKKKLPSLRTASELEQSVAEERCGKCDHRFQI